MENGYEVEVIYRRRAFFLVQAADRETAERRAIERWQKGASSEIPGYDWCEIEEVRTGDAANEERQTQDAALILRFIRERERLLLRIGGDPFSPAGTDAISADRVAADLGWFRPASAAASGPDTLRAVRALESLCDQHRLVCFQRTRVRSGERGEIRLYCTPEYLESLSSSVTELIPQTI